MKKVFLIFSLIVFGTVFVFGQSEDELFGGSDFISTSDDELFGGSDSSDDDLFGSDDDLFGSDDDLFSDDGIEEITDTTAKDNLSKGILFEAGSVRVGGSLRAGIDTNTKLYNPDESNFGENIKNTTLAPTLSAYLSVDARPTETLRIYTKFGMAYPFKSSIQVNLMNLMKMQGNIGKVVVAGAEAAGGAGTGTEDKKPDSGSEGAGSGGTGSGGSQQKPNIDLSQVPGMGMTPEMIGEVIKNSSIKDWLSLKELFTDFSIKDRAFFRFGLHTVSWGTGYFFSPVSNMINTSPIDPENPTEQVNGALNLRTQIVFPGSQNCLWFYLIPSNDFAAGSAEAYARDTALAGKFDLVLGSWELGFGTFWKYESAPKVMMTASGSIKKLSLFSEFVYQYGGADEWKNNKDWGDKTSIFHATVGGNYIWKDPGIMLSLQYYFDSNDIDLGDRIYTNGHNVALMANFSKLGKVKELSASIFGIANFGRAGLPENLKQTIKEQGQNPDVGFSLPCLMINANLNYRPIDEVSLSIGPSIVFTDFEKEPTVSLKIGATLGGGKF